MAAAGRPRHRRLRIVLAVLALLFALWAAGLADFVRRIPGPGMRDEGTADGIVVLTGGAERLREGLRLLAEERAPRLFVSGVHRDATLAQILAYVPEYQADRRAAEAVACCVELGHAADNTAGNARETAGWISDGHLKSIFLVTADYHMPRSLLEFHRALPGTLIKPHAVFPEDSVRRDWWRRADTLVLVLVEYHKYLLALLRGLFDPGPAVTDGPHEARQTAASGPALP
ncbi:MAG: YdcF family protein [Rhodospirillaceae bacterium]|nr:YdcF family protein [Rhodospirillaceae bacterium]